GGAAEVGALRVALGDRGADGGVSVALHHRAEPVVEVPHLVAVDIPHLRPRGARGVDGPRVAQRIRRRDAGGRVRARALVQVARWCRRWASRAVSSAMRARSRVMLMLSSCMTAPTGLASVSPQGREALTGRPGAGSGPKTPPGYQRRRPSSRFARARPPGLLR